MEPFRLTIGRLPLQFQTLERNTFGAVEVLHAKHNHAAIWGYFPDPSNLLTAQSEDSGFATDNPLVGSNDVVSYLAQFVNDQQYLFFASVCRCWRDAWGRNRPKLTQAVTSDTSASQLSFSIRCGLGREPGLCAAIAILGRLDLLRWARSEGCRWNWLTCYNAAEGGHLGVLQWARACFWNSTTCCGAAERGHLEVLQ